MEQGCDNERIQLDQTQRDEVSQDMEKTNQGCKLYQDAIRQDEAQVRRTSKVRRTWQ